MASPGLRTALLLPLSALLLGLGEDPQTPGPPPFEPAAARELAETKLDEARGKGSREKYRIIWPEGEPKLPEPGAEAVLIGGLNGQRSNLLVVLRWTGTAVEERHLTMSGIWPYDRVGESLSTGAWTFPAEEVSTRWAAAFLIAGARAERKGPPPDPLRGSTSIIVGPRSPEAWLRITAPQWRTPIFLGNGRGCSSDEEGVRSFDDTRSELLFNMLHVLYQLARQREERTPMEGRPTIESWQPFLRAEMARFLESGVPSAGDEGLLLIEVGLRALALVGDSSDLPLVWKVDAHLAKGDPMNTTAWRCRLEARTTVARLLFRGEWDVALAAATIRGIPRGGPRPQAVAGWIRDRFREKDPGAYRVMLLEDLRIGTRDVNLLLEAIPEVARWMPLEARALLAPLADTKDEAVLEAVAKALESLAPAK